ncbi:MAG: hypothetical protein WB716_11490 [Candidatus Acidiferrales bacterium]
MLDIIKIRMIDHVPHGHQSENHLIDAEYTWVKVGRATWQDLDAAVDEFPGALWIDGDNSYNGLNDRVSEAQASTCHNSLMLLQPEKLVVTVAVEGAEFDNPRRKIRAHFTCGGRRYILAVTDPVIEEHYRAKKNGEYPIKKARLCVSLGGPYEGYCYKLVAGIITPEED